MGSQYLRGNTDSPETIPVQCEQCSAIQMVIGNTWDISHISH